jgi:ABC-type uncharacterized transport system substrate-binding protein
MTPSTLMHRRHILHRPHPEGRQPSRTPSTAADQILLIVNLKTAKPLDLTIADRVLDIADELIE